MGYLLMLCTLSYPYEYVSLIGLIQGIHTILQAEYIGTALVYEFLQENGKDSTTSAAVTTCSESKGIT